MYPLECPAAQDAILPVYTHMQRLRSVPAALLAIYRAARVVDGGSATGSGCLVQLKDASAPVQGAQYSGIPSAAAPSAVPLYESLSLVSLEPLCHPLPLQHTNDNLLVLDSP